VSVGTAFHPHRAAQLHGAVAASAYHDSHEIEYNAIREEAALIEASPLYKRLVSGPDSHEAHDRVITLDAGKLAVGRVYYMSWCVEHGRVLDGRPLALWIKIFECLLTGLRALRKGQVSVRKSNFRCHRAPLIGQLSNRQFRTEIDRLINAQGGAVPLRLRPCGNRPPKVREPSPLQRVAQPWAVRGTLPASVGVFGRMCSA
jgi:hypothetical protein